MGALCNVSSANENNEILTKPEAGREFKLKKYNSMHDKPFTAFENKHNLLQYIKLTEFSILFNNFHFDSSVTEDGESKKKLFSEKMEKMEFLSFFKIKITNHHLLYDLKNDYDSSQIFLDFLDNLYDIICKGMTTFVKKHNENSTEKIKDKKPKKYLLIALGLLFCSSEGMTKIDYLFNAFSNDKNKIEADFNFKCFLFILILIASYGTINAIDQLRKNYHNEIAELDQKEFLETYDIYEVGDMITIQTEFIKDFFGPTGILSYTEFKEKILRNGFDWILNGSGIRFQLEKKDANEKMKNISENKEE